jgi:hypothetical protein
MAEAEPRDGGRIDESCLANGRMDDVPSRATALGHEAMPGERAISRLERRECRSFLANGRASCPGPHLSIDLRFWPDSSNNAGVSSVGEPSRLLNSKGRGWLCSSRNHRPYPTSRRGSSWSCTPTPYASGVAGLGLKAISPWPISQGEKVDWVGIARLFKIKSTS